MSLVTLKEILAPAYKRGYAVGAFNAVDSHFVKAVIGAAVEKKSPVILNIAEVHYPYCIPEQMMPMFIALAKNSPVPVAINLDHGLTLDAVNRALKSGFTSIMFDGSKYGFEENINKTSEIVKLCHSKGVSVEAELGAVGGEEGGGLIGSVDRSLMTNPEQAERFVNETTIDALAVAIGNCHGKYKGDPDLAFDLLEKIRNKVSCPLVLHGGSGISEKDFKKAISLGIAKINFYTGMSQSAIFALQEAVQKAGQAYNDYPLIMEAVRVSVKKTVMQQMDIFGSSNKA